MKHYAMKTYGEIEVKFHSFFTMVLYGDEWTTSRSRCFIPGERAPDTLWIGGCMCSIASLDLMLKENISAPVGNRTFRPARSQSL